MKRFSFSASSAFLVLMAIATGACSNGGGSDAGADAASDGSTNPVSCMGDFDCPSAGQHCFFAIDGHCSVAGQTGTCMDFVTDKCQPNIACGCDGTTISACGPPGYVNRSSNFAGPCPTPEAGADADTDASNDASSD